MAWHFNYAGEQPSHVLVTNVRNKQIPIDVAAILVPFGGRIQIPGWCTTTKKIASFWNTNFVKGASTLVNNLQFILIFKYLKFDWNYSSNQSIVSRNWFIVFSSTLLWRFFAVPTFKLSFCFRKATSEFLKSVINCLENLLLASS